MATGPAETPDEATDKAIRPTHEPEAKNLSDLLLNSPLAGADLNLERCQDHPRPVDIE